MTDDLTAKAREIALVIGTDERYALMLLVHYGAQAEAYSDAGEVALLALHGRGCTSRGSGTGLHVVTDLGRAVAAILAGGTVASD